MLFLLTAISKMKEPKDGGSHIAIIHNGSPLFTGDAGSPSEIRKYILENDLLEAIIALPNDIFYNTGIATYIWVLSNKKAGTKREGQGTAHQRQRPIRKAPQGSGQQAQRHPGESHHGDYPAVRRLCGE